MRISMEHGAGGALMQKLIMEHVLKHFSSDVEVPLEALDDSAVVEKMVFTTDMHTVKPLFFPGGDLGKLAVAGTINDLAVVGAKPLALSCGMALEEGLELEVYERILASMEKESTRAGVPIITGDTKVVERGSLEKVLVNTSGIGKRSAGLDKNLEVVKRYRNISSKWILDSNLKPGDKLILTGTIGDHGIALLSFREGYGFDTSIKSDIASLNWLIEKVLEVGGVVAMKDPTRGGLANTLHEFAAKSKIGIVVEENQIPVKEGVRSVGGMLGIDVLQVGNEGKVVIGVVKELAKEVLGVLKATKEGKDAAIIGECTRDVKGVVMQTSVGGRRIIDLPRGDPIPRIC